MKSKLIIACATLLSLTALAENPLVTHIYTADPTARVHEGKLYVYPSCDTIPPAGVDCPRFCMPGYHAFSLENGSTWKDHGSILRENEVPWGDRNTFAMWAPDCIEKDGKYYYYYPAKPAKDNAFRRIGVGVSDNPTGPFKWEKNYIDGVSGIDPGLMIADDGQAYLYFGGGQELYGVRLADNMKKIVGEPVKIEGLPAGYKEGSFAFMKDGLVYFTFAHVFAGEGYTIGYATSKDPLGPFEYRGKIMDNIDNGTNHHSVVKYNDRWILFYHFWHLSGNNKMRSMCADYMEFNKDGSIRKVTPTLRGIGEPTLGDTIQIDRYNEISNAATAFVGGDEPDGWMVCDARNEGYVRFNKVNFGENGAEKVSIRMAAGQRFGSVELRVDNPKTGDVVATWDVEFTGGWNKWVTRQADVATKVTGLHDIYLVFKNDWGATKVANVNWLVLE